MKVVHLLSETYIASIQVGLLSPDDDWCVRDGHVLVLQLLILGFVFFLHYRAVNKGGKKETRELTLICCQDNSLMSCSAIPKALLSTSLVGTRINMNMSWIQAYLAGKVLHMFSKCQGSCLSPSVVMRSCFGGKFNIQVLQQRQNNTIFTGCFVCTKWLGPCSPTEEWRPLLALYQEHSLLPVPQGKVSEIP